MEPPNFESCQAEELIQFARQANSRQIESHISKLRPAQIPIFIEALNEQTQSEWKEKIKAAITGLNERPQLEAAGSALSIPQFLELINSCLQVEDKHHWKLSPLLVGMKHETFSRILEHLPNHQLQALKDEGVTEPVQHHLTTCAHEMEREIEKEEKEIDLLYEKVDQFTPEKTGLTEIRHVIQEIERSQELFTTLIKKNNKLLAIAWNTKRLDLIESLNQTKESCRKFTLYGLGAPLSAQTPASGLYQLLEEKLFTVYGNGQDPRDPETVRDTEPAVEGLAKLSVWYLRDYWEIGLLPDIKEKNALDLDLDTHSEIERVQFREKLFTKAQQNLVLLGLTTVQDLKTHYIFSKKTLQEYIQEKMPPVSTSD